ncbi:MAG: hypothetical protein ABS81_11020 [Pseudonocardia sp. SCN 72-86]|nr:MAG: hypothetical protein ABS81_11020 [Pseudonocardia sp. SCN 72-86]
MPSEVEQPRHQWPFPRSCPLDPPPALAELRSSEPITRVRLWNGDPAWLATRYADVRALLADHGRLSSDTSRPGFPQTSATVAAMRGQQKVFIRQDPPSHDEHRLMLTADFTVKKVRSMRPYLEQLVDGCLDAMEEAGRPVDLVRLLAQPVPANVIVRLLDLPAEHSEFFLDRVARWMSLDSSPEESREAGEDALGYFASLIEQRRAEPGDDLVSRLIQDQVATGVFSEAQLQHMLHLLLVGGFDTTANMIALGTIVLLEHSEQFAELRAEPDRIPAAVEELLRYLSVAHHVGFRLAVDEVEIDGVCIRPGEGVIAPIMAANRDPEVFPDPDAFDIHRDARAHVAFGFGVHQCLGQALARVELQVVFGRLLERFPHLALAVPVDELRFKNSLIYGVEELPVTW